MVGTLLVGVVLSTLLALQWEGEEEKRYEEQLHSLTVLRKAYVDSALLRYSDLLSALSSYEAQSDHGAEGFEQFVENQLAWQVGIDNTAYIGRSWDGTASVQYTAPYPTRLPPGADLLENAERRAAMNRAVDVGLPVIGPVGLLPSHPARGKGDVQVVEVYAAVYRPGAAPTTIEDRRARTIGWVALTIDLQEVLASLVVSGGGLDMVLFVGDEFLGESRPGAAERIASSTVTEELEIYTGTLPLRLRTTFAPGSEPPSTSRWLLLGGLVMSSLLAYAIAITLRHRRQLEGQAEVQRQRAELMTSRFYAAVDEAPVGVVVSDLAGNVELFNERLRKLVGAPKDAEVSIFDYLLPENQDEIVASLGQIASGERDRVVSERQLRRHDGTLMWCRLSTAALRDADGAPTGIVAHVQDIEAERKATEELRSRERWFSSIVEYAQDLIVLIDRDLLVKWASPQVERLYHAGAQGLIGQPVLSTVHEDDRDRVATALQQIRVGEPVRVEFRLSLGPGVEIWMESTATNRLDDPDVEAIITVARDVTARHRTTRALVHRASHDPLTGLLNRDELEVRLGAALEGTDAAHELLTLAFIDIDHFKDVNDERGHQTGDEVLRAVATAIQAEVRDQDLVARIGGDEMVVGLVGADLSTAIAVVERIRRRLQDPLDLATAAPLAVTASIGLAMARAGDTVGTLLHRADIALYEAKRQGRNRFTVYSDDLAGLSGAAGGTRARDIDPRLADDPRDDDDLVLDLSHLFESPT